MSILDIDQPLTVERKDIAARIGTYIRQQDGHLKKLPGLLAKACGGSDSLWRKVVYGQYCPTATQIAQLRAIYGDGLLKAAFGEDQGKTQRENK